MGTIAGRYIPDAPGLIRFEEKECCALRTALNENKSAIDFFLSAKPKETKEICLKLIDLFTNKYTINLGIILQYKQIILLKEVIISEKKRLKEAVTKQEEKIKSCGCAITQHFKTLAIIADKLKINLRSN